MQEKWQCILTVLVKGRQCGLLTSCRWFGGFSPYSWTSRSAERLPESQDSSPEICNPTTKFNLRRLMHRL